MSDTIDPTATGTADQGQYVYDTGGMALRSKMFTHLKDPQFGTNLANANDAVDLAQKAFPTLTREQTVDMLPQIHKALTGNDAPPDPKNLFDGISSMFQSSVATLMADNARRQKEDFDKQNAGLNAKLKAQGKPEFKMNPLTQTAIDSAPVAQKKSEAFANEAWYPLTNAIVGGGVGIVGTLPEIAAGGVVGGPVGATMAGLHSMSTMITNTSFASMRDKGVPYEKAAPASDIIGGVSALFAGLVTAGTGALFKPVIDRAVIAAMPSIERVLMTSGAGAISKAVIPEKIAGVATGAIESNLLARTAAVGGLAAESSAAGTLGMGAMGVTQDVGENMVAESENASRKSANDSKIEAYIKTIDTTKKYLSSVVLSAVNEANSTSLIPVKDPEKIVSDALDQAGTNALANGILGGLGIAGATAVRRVKEIVSKPKAEIPAAVNYLAHSVQTEHAIQTAVPQPEAKGDFVKSDAGNEITVYHASTPLSTLEFNGFHEDPERAQADAHLQSEGPLDAEKFSETLRSKYPGVVADAADAVVKAGPEAAAPFEAQLKTWASENPGTNPNDILTLAKGIHDGEPVSDRNELVARYGLEDALPSLGIVEAKIQADKVAHVDYQSEVPKAFEDGAQAVEHDGTWYVKDASHVVVTGKTDSQADTIARNPVGEHSFNSNGNTLILNTAKGSEAGRATTGVEGDTVKIHGLTEGPQYAGQGVAETIAKRLIDQNPGKTINWGDTAPEMVDRVRKQLPTWDEYGSKVARAESSGNDALAEFYRQKADTIPKEGGVLLGQYQKPMNMDQVREILAKQLPHDEIDAAISRISEDSINKGVPFDKELERVIDPSDTLHEDGVDYADAEQEVEAKPYGGYKFKTDKAGSLTLHGDPEEIRSLLPPEIQGTVGDGKIDFPPSMAHRVKAILEGSDNSYSRGGKIEDNPRYESGDRKGQYIGAPDVANTPGKIGQFRKKLLSLTLEGERGKFWYEHSGESLLKLTGGDKEAAKKLAAVLAIYSPQAKVDSNSTFGARAWAQHYGSGEISTKTKVQNDFATKVLSKGEAWGGEKTNNFFRNLLRVIDPKMGAADKQGVTVDMWMMRAFGYNNDSPTAAQYRFVENESNKIAKDLGWEPQQVQAAIWVAMKARMENAGVKSATEAKSEAKGWLRYDKGFKEGRATKVRVILDAQSHRNNWLDQAFAHQVTEKDTGAAKFDFADGLERHMGQISWEARPGRTTGVLPGIHDAPYHEQLEFQKAVGEALLDSGGHDMLAQKLGILRGDDTLLPGVWEGDIAAGTQSGAIMAPGKDIKGETAYIDPSQKKLLDAYSAVMGLLLRQEGVGYHRPFWKENKGDNNALEIQIGRPLTSEETRSLWQAVNSVMKDYPEWQRSMGVVSTPNGVRLINFGAAESIKTMQRLKAEGMTGDSLQAKHDEEMSWAALTDRKETVKLFLKAVEEWHKTTPDDLATTTKDFHSDGNLVENNWKEHPDGQEYASRISDQGRSDLLRWATDVLGPKVQRVYQDFSERYGWGDPGTVPGLDPARVKSLDILEESRRQLDERYDELNSRGPEQDGPGVGSDRRAGDLPSEGTGTLKDYWAYQNLEKAKTVDIIGAKIPRFHSQDGALKPKAAEGLYNVMKIYRDRQFETFRFVFIDKKGNIKDHIAVSAEHPTRTPIAPAGESMFEHLEMVRKMSEGNDTQVVMVHNHPSGEVSPSSADEAVTHKVWQALGERYAGHIILDHGEFASSQGVSTATRGRVPFGIHQLDEVTERDPTFASGTLPDWVGTQSSPESMQDLALYVDRDESSIPTFMASGQGKLSAMHYIPRGVWEGPRDALAQHLIDVHKNTGTIWAFPIVDGNDYDLATGHHASGLIMDAIQHAKGSTWSRAIGYRGGSALDSMDPKSTAHYVSSADAEYTPARDSAIAESEKKINDNERTLEAYERAAPALLEKLAKRHTPEEKVALKAQIDSVIETHKKANAADRANLEAVKANPVSTKDQAERESIKAAVESGKVVPGGYLDKYSGEDWAQAEIKNRQDMREQIDHARQFDSPEAYVASVMEDRLWASLDPFEATPEQEAAARESLKLTDEERAKLTQVYEISHAKTPEESDAKFKASLTPDKVKTLLAGMNEKGYLADKGLPASILKLMAKPELTEADVARAQKAMAGDPSTYRKIEQQIHGDQTEMETLALEDSVTKAGADAEELPPEVKRIELPTEMSLEDKAAIRLGTASRAHWQRKALDAKAEATELNRAMTMLENLSDKWSKKTDEASSIEDDLDRVAAESKVGGSELTRLTSKLRDLRKEDPSDSTATKDRAVSLISDLTKQIKDAVKAKEAERRVYKAQRDQMRMMGEYLAKPVSKSIHVDFARQIEGMRGLVDPNFRTEASASRIDNRAQWFRDHPEAKMTDKLKREVFARNLNDWEYADLHNLYTERKALEDMGRAKLDAKHRETESRRFDLRREVIDAVYNKGAQMKEKLSKETDGGKRAELAQKILQWEIKRAENTRNLNNEAAKKFNKGGVSYLLTLSNLADNFDGMADFKGINHKLLWNDANTAENAHLTQSDRRKTAMLKWIKDEKINVNDLSKTVAIPGIQKPYSLDELMDIYIGAKNERKDAALRYGNKIDQVAFDFANTSKDLEWVRKMGDKLLMEYEENKPRLFDTIREYDNFDPVEESSYSPMSRAELNLESMDEQLQWEAGMASAVKKASVEKGFTKARVDVPEQYQKPIKLGAWTSWLDQVQRQEQYIAYTPLIKDLNAIYQHEEVKDAITQVHGKQAWQEIDKYVKALSNKYHDKTFSKLDKIASKLSGNAALAYMAYNVATVLKQTASAPFFLAYTNPIHLTTAAAKLLVPWKLMKDVGELSIQMKTRVGYDELELMRLWNKDPVSKAVQTIATPGMKPMQLMDQLIACAGWDAAYHTALLDKKWTHTAAVEYADFIVGKTQQSTHVKDTAGVMRDNNSLVKAMTLFSGPSIKVFNDLIYTPSAMVKNGHYLTTVGALAAIGLSSYIYYSLGQGRAPKDEKELAHWELMGLVNQFPIIGSALQSVVQGYDAGGTLFNQVAKNIGETGKELSIVLTDSDEAKREAALPKAALGALDVGGLSTGAPTLAMKRIYNAVKTGNGWELVGWHDPTNKP